MNTILNKALIMFSAIFLTSCGLMNTIYKSYYSNKYNTSRIAEPIAKKEYEFENLVTALVFTETNQDLSKCNVDEIALNEGIYHLRHKDLNKAKSIFKSLLNSKLLIDNKDSISSLAQYFYDTLENPYDVLGMPQLEIKFNKGNEEIKMKIEDNKIYIEVYIDNDKYLFLLDNASTLSHIRSDLLAKINAKSVDYQAQIKTVSQLQKKQMYLSPKITIGNIEINNLIVAPEDADSKYFGIIGFDILSQIDLRIDLKNETILMKEPNPKDLDTNHNYYWFKAPFINAINCDGQRIRMIMDLAGDKTTLFKDYFDFLDINSSKVFTQKEDKQKISDGTASSTSIDVKFANDICLIFSEYKFDFSKMVAINLPKGSIPFIMRSMGLVAPDIFMNGRIRLDYKNGIFKYEE